MMEKLHPEYVNVQDNSVTLRFSKPVTSVSYVPDYAYDDGVTVFQGPWLVNADGVGALTFHNVAVTTTDVFDEQEPGHSASERVIIQQSALPSHYLLRSAQSLFDISGQSYSTSAESLQTLSPGMYTAIVNSYPRCFVVVP